jgi:hypothetical protein
MTPLKIKQSRNQLNSFFKIKGIKLKQKIPSKPSELAAEPLVEMEISKLLINAL